jgi:hypothetical protein
MGLRIDHVHIKAVDPKETMNFFVEGLGGVMLAELREGRYGYQVDLHGLVLNITTLSPGQTYDQRYGIEHIAIETDEIAETLDDMTQRGADLLEEVRSKDGRRVGYLEISDGVRFEIIEAASL